MLMLPQSLRLHSMLLLGQRSGSQLRRASAIRVHSRSTWQRFPLGRPRRLGMAVEMCGSRFLVSLGLLTNYALLTKYSQGKDQISALLSHGQVRERPKSASKFQLRYQAASIFSESKVLHFIPRAAPGVHSFIFRADRSISPAVVAELLQTW